MDKPSNNSQRMNLSLDYRVICVVLLVAIVAMLVIWKPWQTPVNVKDRTVTVTGEATLKAVPDEYVFSPMYTFTNSDKQAALAQVTAKSDEVVAKLKALGVANKDIKTNSDGWSYYYDSGTPTYSLRLTITVNNSTLAQKVQDYLVSTTPTGEVSPQVTFSNSKQKALEVTARAKASTEARAKADQSAKNLGFKVAAVKSVSDGAGFNGPIYTLDAKAASLPMDSTSGQSLALQPGENELNYSVTVVYYIK